MKDPLKYTKDELVKNLILAETHLKQAVTGTDEQFCKECLDKHFYNIEGLADEGPSFTKDKSQIKIFSNLSSFSKDARDKDYKNNGIKMAQKVREFRKSLTDECPECKTLTEDEIEDLTKDLNTSNSYSILGSEDTHTHNSSEPELNWKNQKMAKLDYATLGYMNAGQFAAEGIRYGVDTYKPEWTKYVGIGGGIGLQALALFIKMPKTLKTISLIAGSNLLAKGVIDMVRTPAGMGVRAPVKSVSVNANGVGGYAGKAYSYAPTFGGKTFSGKVTAQNIPSQYARAGILSGAQAFESPEHADLIRVD